MALALRGTKPATSKCCEIPCCNGMIRWSEQQRVSNYHRKASFRDSCELDSLNAHGRAVESWHPRTQTFRVHPSEVHEVWLSSRSMNRRLYCPQLLSYFEEIGYDVSIIVSKWFITLFAYVSALLSFHLDASLPVALPFVGLYSSSSTRSNPFLFSIGRE